MAHSAVSDTPRILSGPKVKQHSYFCKGCFDLAKKLPSRTDKRVSHFKHFHPTPSSTSFLEHSSMGIWQLREYGMPCLTREVLKFAQAAECSSSSLSTVMYCNFQWYEHGSHRIGTIGVMKLAKHYATIALAVLFACL